MRLENLNKEAIISIVQGVEPVTLIIPRELEYKVSEVYFNTIGSKYLENRRNFLTGIEPQKVTRLDLYQFLKTIKRLEIDERLNNTSDPEKIREICKEIEDLRFPKIDFFAAKYFFRMNCSMNCLIPVVKCFVEVMKGENPEFTSVIPPIPDEWQELLREMNSIERPWIERPFYSNLPIAPRMSHSLDSLLYPLVSNERVLTCLPH